MDNNHELEARGHATAAREHVYGFNRATIWERDQIPAETSDELAEFADLAAALPQAFAQLSSTLERALADQVLSMDSMTDESDPAMESASRGSTWRTPAAWRSTSTSTSTPPATPPRTSSARASTTGRTSALRQPWTVRGEISRAR